MKINWVYADKFGELPSGEAENVEALVAIAEQLAELNRLMQLVSTALEEMAAK